MDEVKLQVEKVVEAILKLVEEVLEQLFRAAALRTQSGVCTLV